MPGSTHGVRGPEPGRRGHRAEEMRTQHRDAEEHHKVTTLTHRGPRGLGLQRAGPRPSPHELQAGRGEGRGPPPQKLGAHGPGGARTRPAPDSAAPLGRQIREDRSTF